jgi:hypothetical protein
MIKGFADLADLPEDDRSFLTYLSAFSYPSGPSSSTRFPLIEFVGKAKGPVKDVVMFVVRRKAN